MDGGYIGAVHSSPKPVARAWRYGSKDGNGSPMIGTAVCIRFSSLSADGSREGGGKVPV
jgi:hypothetical protein